MRNYVNFDGYLDRLSMDVYPQPDDDGHTEFASEFIDWACGILDSPGTVLDVGCGQGFCAPLFHSKGYSWTGVTLGDDYNVCRRKGLPVFRDDMSFLPQASDSFDYVFSRHSLEHSPFPILTLMEWRRISRKHLLLVVPAPDFWGVGGKNHYSVLDKNRWWYLFTRAGWNPIHERTLKTTDALFLRHYMPHLKGKDRDNLEYPGAPLDVEWWYVLEPSKERIE